MDPNKTSLPSIEEISTIRRDTLKERRSYIESVFKCLKGEFRKKIEISILVQEENGYDEASFNIGREGICGLNSYKLSEKEFREFAYELKQHYGDLVDFNNSSRILVSIPTSHTKKK